MKIFKSKIIAVVLTLAMVLSVLAVPVTAAEVTAPAAQPATAQAAADFLAANDLLQGDNGDLMLDKELTREQMVVILSRLMGEEETAIAYPTDSLTFTDVPLEDEYAPYIAWAQETGITQGYDETTFGFGDSLTAWQTKAFFVRALGFVETADEEIIAKADELKVSTGSTVEDTTAITRADMALLMSNTVYATNAEGTRLGETIGVLTPEVVVPPVPAAAEVASASVATDSSVKVVFSSAVADTTKLAFELKGTSVVETTVTWNEAKTEATLTAPSVLIEGAYTAKVTGEGVVADKNTATFVVVKNGVAKIEILSTKLVQTDTNSGTFKYKLLDNYGTDITESYASDITIVSSVGNGTVTDAKLGIATIDRSAGVWQVNPATPETIAVTIIGKTTAVSANATLTVADASKVDTVTLKDIVYPTTTPATVKILTEKPTAAYVTLEAKDQYGEQVKDVARLTHDAEVLYVVSDGGVTVSAESFTDTDNTENTRLAINTSLLTVAKSVTVTAVSKATGKSTLITLSIQKAAAPDKVTMLSQETVVAAGDLEDSFILPFKAYDQYGVELTSDEIVSNATNFVFGGDFEETIDGAGDGKYAVKIATSGVNKGKIVNTEALPATAGTKVLTVSVTGGTGVGTYSVDVKDAAYEKTIKLDTAPATNLLAGSVSKFDYKFLDQYGREIENFPGSPAVVDIEVSNAEIISVTADSQTTNIGDKIIETAADVIDAANSASVTTGTTTGSATITAKLKKDGLVISTVSTTVNVVSGVPGNLTIQVADIPELSYAAAATAGADSIMYTADDVLTAATLAGASPYARPILITAKDANGTTFALPSNRILSVTSSDTRIADVNNAATPLGDVVIDAQDNNFVVAGKTTAFNADPALGTVDVKGATKTATITVVVSTDNGPVTVTKTVTVKYEAPRATAVKFYDTAALAATPYGPEKDAKEITSIVGPVADIDTTVVYVVTVDQYGVYSNQAADYNFKVVNTDRATVTQIAYQDANDTLNVTGFESKLKRDSDVYLMYTAPSNVYGTFSIKATDSYTEIAAPTILVTSALGNKATAGNVGVVEVGDTITLNFSEAMNATAIGTVFDITISDAASAAIVVNKDAAAGIVATITATGKQYFTAAGPETANNSIGVWSNGNKTLTITLGALGGGATAAAAQTAAATSIVAGAGAVDVVGNAASTTPVVGASSRF